jgi:hypothetical protein
MGMMLIGNSDYSGGQTKLPKILLNGNNICMVHFILFDEVHLANMAAVNTWR